MSTTPLTDGMQALINYANETTGESDATLSDAIDSLVSGYGSGGGFEPVFETTFNSTVDATTSSTYIATVNIESVPRLPLLTFSRSDAIGTEIRVEYIFGSCATGAVIIRGNGTKTALTNAYGIYVGNGISVGVNNIYGRVGSTFQIPAGTYTMKLYSLDSLL